MRKLMFPITLIIVVALMGCAATTKVFKEGKEVMRFEHSSDAVVTYKDKEVEASVDDRGRPSLIEQLIVAPFARQPVLVPK